MAQDECYVSFVSKFAREIHVLSFHFTFISNFLIIIIVHVTTLCITNYQKFNTNLTYTMEAGEFFILFYFIYLVNFKECQTRFVYLNKKTTSRGENLLIKVGIWSESLFP